MSESHNFKWITCLRNKQIKLNEGAWHLKIHYAQSQISYPCWAPCTFADWSRSLSIRSSLLLPSLWAPPKTWSEAPAVEEPSADLSPLTFLANRDKQHTSQDPAFSEPLVDANYDCVMPRLCMHNERCFVIIFQLEKHSFYFIKWKTSFFFYQGKNS